MSRGVRHEIVTVEAVAAQRDEQRAGLDRARVGQDGAEVHVVALHDAACGPREIVEIALHQAVSPSARRTMSRSLNGSTSRPTIW